MKTASDTYIGSSLYAARRAADVAAVLRNTDRHDSATLIERLKMTLASYGELDPHVLPSELDEFINVADKIYRVFAAQTIEEVARELNELFKQYAHAPRLTMHNGTPWHLHVDASDHMPWAEWFGASSAHALATLLAEKQRKPGGLCAEPCGRPFIDLGKGGGRSYCSPKCATRARVAVYRSKLKA